MVAVKEQSRLNRAVIETLESRQLYSGEGMALASVGAFSTFDGVGFQRNPVADLVFTKDGKLADAVQAGVVATVNFGDGTGWIKAELAPTTSFGTYVVKASHVYKVGTNKSFYVETKVTAGDVTTTMKGSAKASVSLMHATAARPGTQPPLLSHPQSLRDESFVISNVGMLHNTFAGVGFSENTVASFYAFNNGVKDTDITHFKAQVNFGDSPNWYLADIARKTGNNYTYLIKNKAHVYTSAGTYAITVMLTGPDGETHAQSTTSMPVYDMPSAASRPGKMPTVIAPTVKPQDVQFTVVSAPAQDLTVNKGNSISLAYFSATVNGVVDTKASNFQAYVNWGDSPNWELGTVGIGVGSSQQFAVIDSHDYAKAGNYDVVVYLVAVDGTTVTQATMQVHVL